MKGKGHASRFKMFTPGWGSIGLIVSHIIDSSWLFCLQGLNLTQEAKICYLLFGLKTRSSTLGAQAVVNICVWSKPYKVSWLWCINVIYRITQPSKCFLRICVAKTKLPGLPLAGLRVFQLYQLSVTQLLKKETSSCRCETLPPKRCQNVNVSWQKSWRQNL